MRANGCFVAAGLVLVTQAWVDPAAIAHSQSSSQTAKTTPEKAADKTK